MTIVANIEAEDRKVVIGNAHLTDVLTQLSHTEIDVREQIEQLVFIGYHDRLGKVWVHCNYTLKPGKRDHVTLDGVRTKGEAKVVFSSWAREYDNDGEPEEQGDTLNSLLVRMEGGEA